ncbi:hypothetical protein RYX36_002842 [Vicia faba]
MRDLEIMEEQVEVERTHGESSSCETSYGIDSLSNDKKLDKVSEIRTRSKSLVSSEKFVKVLSSLSGPDTSPKSKPKGKNPSTKSPMERKNDKPLKKQTRGINGVKSSKSSPLESNGKSNLKMVVCLHVTGAIYCSLGQHSEAILILKRSIEIPYSGESQQHALAKFSGHVQLGDTYAMLGQLENSIKCYTAGFEVQGRFWERRIQQLMKLGS